MYMLSLPAWAAATTGATTSTATGAARTTSTTITASASAVATTVRTRTAITGATFAVAVEVRLIARGLGEFLAALDGKDFALGDFPTFGSHLRALLFQDRFARETDAVAFDGKHFYKDLIAFFQFVADVLDAVLGNFADVQQAIGARDDFDKGAEVRQPRDLAKIGLPYFRGSGYIADHLQRPGSGRLV
jgi:hypothetical protein